MVPSIAGFTGLELACIATRSRSISDRSRSLPLTMQVIGSRDRPVASSTAFCLAVPARPRNSETSSRMVISRPLLM